jgi:hypothetical protein
VLSIIVPWRDRGELKQTLPSLVEATRLVGGDLTVVNFGGSADLLESQTRDYDGVRVAQVSDRPFFSKACCQNLGAACTGLPLLFFCDCDIVLNPGMVRGLADRLVSETGVFATLAGVRETEVNSRRAGHITRFGYQLEIHTADGRALRIIDHEEDATDGTRQAPGLLLVRRADFLAINGYNSRLPAGWGWEDQDMIARLTLGAGLSRILDGFARHISHDDHARIAHYPPVKDRWESRDRMFRQALANYDRKDFLGSYDRDIEEVPCVLLEG